MPPQPLFASQEASRPDPATLPGALLQRNQTPQIPLTLPGHGNPSTFPNAAQMDPALQNMLNASLAVLGQQMHGANGAGFVPGSPAPHGDTVLPRHQTRPPPMSGQFQQILAQQQQARAAAGNLGIGNLGPRAVNTTEITNQQQPVSTATQQSGLSDGAQSPQGDPRPASAPPPTTVRQEGTMQNGAQWRMVFNQTTTARLPFPHGVPSISPPIPPLHPVAMGLPGHGFPQGSVHPSQDHGRQPSWPANPLVLMHQRLSMLEATLDTGGAPSEFDIFQAQAQLHHMIQTNQENYGSIAGPLHARLANLAMRSAQARAQSVRPPASQLGSQNASTTSISSTTSFSNTNTPVIYLLSSPHGPQALVMSPDSVYATAGYNNAMMPPTGVNINRITEVPPNPAPVQAQAVGQPRNQINDLIRILLPMGGNLWLLVRLLGVVYMFTGGWKRTLLLGLGAIIAFVAQTGALLPLQRAVWAPFRQHVERILDGGRGNAEALPPANNPGAPRTPAGEPTAAATAERLVLERRRQNQHFLMESIRRVERAAALFVASLVPGVGERHIAAQDAAEATRQAEQRAREEQENQLAVEDAVEGAEAGHAGGNLDEAQMRAQGEVAGSRMGQNGQGWSCPG